jgi:hypothetical protein
LSGFEALQRLAQVLLALAADAWHLLAAGEIGAVAEHALVLLRQRLALLHPRRVGRREPAAAARAAACRCVGEAAQVGVGEALGHRVIAGLSRRPSRNRKSWVIA